MNIHAEKTALVTGANSGLGFEAAAQLAEAGFGRVILACRTLEKAEAAKQALALRVGSNPYETLAVDLASLRSSEAASAELIRRGVSIDALLLNAGIASGEEMRKSEDGIELSFASSIIGHHVITLRLLEANLLGDDARVVLAGSEAARGDLPAMMGMKLYDFATEAPQTFGTTLHDAMLNFAKGSCPEQFNGTHYYATTKLFSAWWSATLARKYGQRVSVFTVSPGANLHTNAARNVTGFKRFLYARVMPGIGGLFGMNMPTAKGAKRFVDVLLGLGADYESGRMYASAPKKLVGPLEESTYSHLYDTERQDAAWGVLAELTGVPAPPQATAAAPVH